METENKEPKVALSTTTSRVIIGSVLIVAVILISKKIVKI